MAPSSTVLTPDYTGVINQKFFLAPLGGPQNPQNYLDRFPDEIYNKSLDSHLVRFLYSLLGPAGIGWLRKNYLEARLKLEDFGLEGFDLDKFYGNPLVFGRILEEMYEEDPSGALSPEQWERIRSKNASYRNRAIDFVSGAKAGTTPLGMKLVARSGLGHEVEIFERYRYLWDQQTDDPLGIPNLGRSNSLTEMVVIPRRELPRSEIQEIVIGGNPTGGFFQLVFPFGDTNVNRTTDIAYNATAGGSIENQGVQEFLENLPAIGKGNVYVTGGPLPDRPIRVHFTGELANKDVPQLQAAGLTLTGGIAPTVAISTTTAGTAQDDEIVSISSRDKYYLIRALERIKPVTAWVSFEQGRGTTSRQIWSGAFSESSQHEVVRYVTGQSGVKWPAPDNFGNWIESGKEKKSPRGPADLTHHYQGYHNIGSIKAYTEAALDLDDYESSIDVLNTLPPNEKIGNYTNYQQILFPVLSQSTDQHFADMAPADYAEPLTVQNALEAPNGNQVSLVNGIYPTSYQNLSGVSQIKYRDEQFWGSIEREEGDDYLEIDLGSVQPVNYIYFEATQKPFDISVSYDLLDLAPARSWTDAHYISEMTSTTRLDYQVAALNPWKPVEIWIENSLGQIVYTRFLRLKFARRIDSDSPFFSNNGLSQYSIEVKNLRLARNIS